MGSNPLLWDEFNPNLYTLKVNITTNNEVNEKAVGFGMRSFLAKGTQFSINDHLTFLSGKLECAIFPKTGYAPIDVAHPLKH